MSKNKTDALILALIGSLTFLMSLYYSHELALACSDYYQGAFANTMIVFGSAAAGIFITQAFNKV